MDYKDIWNDFCFQIKQKFRNSSEREFQLVVEQLFGKLGWLQYKGEIVTQKIIPVGAVNNVKPDIIIKTDGLTLFVVELKRPNASMTERNIEQLFSYMRLLKINFGILIGETLQIYYELENNDQTPIQVNDISFDKDSEAGINFIRLISKSEYSNEKFHKYCTEKIDYKRKQEDSKKYISLLCSEQGQTIIINLLKEKLSMEYSEEIVNSIISEINISISRKKSTTDSQQVISSPIGTNLFQKSITKSEAINLCRLNGLNLNGEITFASKGNGSNTYWANPDIHLLSVNWWLILNDTDKGKLHIFNVPRDSINKNQIKVRVDKPRHIDIQILYGNDLFEDMRSKIQFSKWFIKTISYGKKKNEVQENDNETDRQF